MAAEKQSSHKAEEPRGFGEHSRGLASEYAHEQGWGLDVEERTKQADAPQDIDGGTDYEYGAADFGDVPVNTALAPESRESSQNTAARGVEANDERRDAASGGAAGQHTRS